MFDCALIWKCSNVELPEAKRYYCHEYDHTSNMTKRNMTNKKNNYDQPVSVQRQFVRFCISKMCRVFFILELIQLNLSYFTLEEGGWRNMKNEKYEKQFFGNNFTERLFSLELITKFLISPKPLKNFRSEKAIETS